MSERQLPTADELEPAAREYCRLIGIDPDDHVRQQKQYHLLSCLDFDDGTSSIVPLASGSMEEMEQLAERIPAIVNSTGKKAVESYLGIVESDKWHELRATLAEEYTK